MSSSPCSIGANDRQVRAGKSKQVRKEIHPQVQPKWRREDAIASAADSFVKKESAVSQIEARHVPDPKIRRKAVGSYATEPFADKCSPKDHHDKMIQRENEKFAKASSPAGIQQIGEKDRASPPRHCGKGKTINGGTGSPTSSRPADLAERVAPKVFPDDARMMESQKFAGHTQDGALTRIGETDHAFACRKKVVRATRKDQDNLLTGPPDARVIKVRKAHADGVMTTYEKAISAREERKQKAVQSQAKTDFLNGFSESDSKGYVFAHKQIPHADPVGKLPSNAGIPGFPGLGNKSGKEVIGRRHFDPSSTDCNQATMSSSIYEGKNQSPNASIRRISNSATRGNEAAAVAQELHKAKYEKALDSTRVFASMTHPDNRPFSEKVAHHPMVKKVPTSVQDNKAPDWWKGDSKSKNSVAPAYEKPGRKVQRVTERTTPNWWPGQ